jgi:16S rRNA C1402 (ribose-2'-O) methylase RsmI
MRFRDGAAVITDDRRLFVMTDGRLLLGATPLGQPSDASRRLVDALGSADVVAAEDTRRVRTLAKALDVASPAGWSASSIRSRRPGYRALIEEIKRVRRCWWSATPACR